MTELAIRESVGRWPGGRSGRWVARAFISGALGCGHSCGSDAALLVSELFGNSVRYNRSGAAGETVMVAVRAWATALSVSRSSAGAARGCLKVRSSGPRCGGATRGFWGVAGLVSGWGGRRRGEWTVTWFELRHG